MFLSNPAGQIQLVRRIVSDNLSARQTEVLIKRLKRPEAEKSAAGKAQELPAPKTGIEGGSGS